MTSESEQTSRRFSRFSVAMVSVTAFIFLVASLWAVVTPAFRAPDEAKHFNSILRLMQGGGWPPPQSVGLVEGTFVAVYESGFVATGKPVSVRYYADLPAFKDPELPQAEYRSVVSGLSTQGYGEITTPDQMTQHPPLYYSIEAILLKILGADGWRWDQLLLGMRLISAMMVAAAVPFIMAMIRLVTRSAAATIVGTVAIAAIPQFGLISGSVSNDALVILSGSATIYYSVLAVRRPEKIRTATIGVGIALGAGLLAKGLVLAAIPVVAIFFIIAGWRRSRKFWRRVLPVAGAMAIAFAVGGWWYVRNLMLYGQVQPSMRGSGRSETAFEGYNLLAFARDVIRRINNTFWGAQRGTEALPTTAVLAAGTAFVVLTLAVLVFSRQRRLLLILSLYPVLVAVLFVYHSWQIYWSTGDFMGLQGRYLYGAIGLYSLVIALAWQGVTRRLTPGVYRSANVVALTFSLIVFGLGISYMSWLYWRSHGEGIDVAFSRMVSAGPLNAATVTVLVVLCFAAWLAATLFTVRSSLTREPGSRRHSQRRRDRRSLAQ